MAAQDFTSDLFIGKRLRNSKATTVNTRPDDRIHSLTRNLGPTFQSSTFGTFEILCEPTVTCYPRTVRSCRSAPDNSMSWRHCGHFSSRHFCTGTLSFSTHDTNNNNPSVRLSSVHGRFIMQMEHLSRREIVEKEDATRLSTIF